MMNLFDRPIRKTRRCARRSATVAAAMMALALAGVPGASPAAAKPAKLEKGAAAKKVAPRSAPTSPHAAAAAAFPTFCEDWMRTLAAREQKSIADIKWNPIADGVQGTYTGYSHEHTCTVKDSGASDPVGRITYLEVRYEKRGPSIPDARQSPPRPVESTEVVELFRYSKGKWIY